MDLDRNAVTTNDGSSVAATGFNADDVKKYGPLMSNGYRHSWDELNRINDGKYEEQYSQRHNRAYTKRTVDVIASMVDLTPYQKRRCESIVDEIDNFSSILPGDRIIIVFAVATLVVNEDGRWLQKEELYDTIKNEIGASESEVRTSRKKLRTYL